MTGDARVGERSGAQGRDATLLALAPQWRFLDSGAADGATNMATDVALMGESRRTGVATFRVYAWDRPTLSLGRHERARDRFDMARLAAEGVGVVRRPTGGRALLHDREITYSVTAPVGALSLTASYAAINTVLLDALARLGVRASVDGGAHRPLRPEGAACFAEPAAGELTVDGAKLVGSAQLREEGALLQHGSILLADDQGRIDRLRVGGYGRRSDAGIPPTTKAATLGAILGRDVGYAEVRDALRSAFEVATSGGAEAAPGGRSLQDDLARLVIAYAGPSWTWRR